MYKNKCCGATGDRWLQSEGKHHIEEKNDFGEGDWMSLWEG